MVKQIVILLMIACSWGETTAQLRVNVSLTSPPILENVEIGRSQRYDRVRADLSPGIEFDNLFPKEKAGAKLHYSMGFYYFNQPFTGIAHIENDTIDNEFISSINARAINMPLLARASFPISELIENNRVGLELGITATTWFKYHLDEIASIKTKDSLGYIDSEIIYSDNGSLIKGFGSKFNFKIVGGIFIYVNRFYLSMRFDMLSLSDMYSNRLDKTWKLPGDYSLYRHASRQGRMKNSFMSLVFSFRLTKK